MGPSARLRLRSGVASYSLCGITHTLLSTGTIDAIGGFLTEPVMSWDALICTSSAALQVVTSTLDEAVEYLRWRTGAATAPPRPQLPVIPLGIHCDDWTLSESARLAARKRLGVSDDEVAILFAGRLSFAAKAHPFQMYEALQAVAEQTGEKLVLLLAGQFFTPGIEKAFRESAAFSCPDVRFLHVDGEKVEDYEAAFAGSDIFLSLADNLQETFGITPLEAMAAGLPTVVSDWDGYRDTVRNGIDGFRITTWAPSAGPGARIAALYEISDDYDSHSSRTSTLVSVDFAQLVKRLITLVTIPELRREMGEAGRLRARQEFDWQVIYPRYRELWSELTARRTRAGASDQPAPASHFAHDDPFRRFVSYATRTVSAATLVTVARGGCAARYAELTAGAMLRFWRMPPELAEKILGASAGGPVSVEELALLCGTTKNQMIEQIARLAKLNLVTLQAPD
jgi:glycosyltransferase involved in cell wall biosynthesis